MVHARRGELSTLRDTTVARHGLEKERKMFCRKMCDSDRVRSKQPSVERKKVSGKRRSRRACKERERESAAGRPAYMLPG